ncbi:MAG: hypothetical protein Q9162_006559 [Coniocarpon cinnabarinum]
MANVRICVCGDDGVGKSSLITSLVKDVFVTGRIQPVLPQITLPPTLGTPDNVTTVIVDTSAQPQDRDTLRKELRKSNVLLLVYSDHYSYERVALFWMPYFRSLGVNVPVVLCANKADLAKNSSTPQIVEDEMLPVMGEWKEIDSCIRTSAREHHNINEAFFLCQKAVTHPIAPLFDSKESNLKPAAVSALRRIFYLCDTDQDGLLSDDELRGFQTRVFEKSISDDDLQDIKLSVRSKDHTAEHVDGVDEDGFIRLNQMFVEKGRHETLWTIFRKFQYADSLTLKESFLHPKFEVPQHASAELSPLGYRFFVDLFLLFDKDNDGGLSEAELSALFSPTPGLPHSWVESDFPSCTMRNDAGYVTLQGWLAQWSMTTFESPKTMLEYLAWLGFESATRGGTTAALKITKARKRRRKLGRVERSVFHCYVLGASDSGKSSLLNAFLSRPFDATYHPTIRPRKAVNSVELQGGKQCYMILEELGELEEAVLENQARLDATDLICFAYDSSNPSSFEHVVSLRERFQQLQELPTVYAALKADLDKAVQKSDMQPDQYTASLSMSAPLHVSATWSSISELFVNLAESAMNWGGNTVAQDKLRLTPLVRQLERPPPWMSSKYLKASDRLPAAHRRDQATRSSLSDGSHHVTEAIGGMYGDNDWKKRDPRPLSFAPSHSEAQLERKASQLSSSLSSANDTPLTKSLSTERRVRPSANGSLHEKRRTPSISSIGNESTSPSLSRTPSTDTANHAFPLNDIDYESSPAAVAQELSNLQAIRRMSMNHDAADPDLPSFNTGNVNMPSVAPSASDDENDTSRLFWVPARLHPELAPKEFKTFVEDRVDRIKKTSSGDENSLSPTSMDRHGSGGSNPNRRRSMLSKTIEAPSDYKDGAEVLERKRSRHQRTPSAETSLQELEYLVTDPTELVRKMSLDASRRSLESNPDSPSDDMPIVQVPAGQTLKRSTRTQYRRGSLRAQGRLGKKGGSKGIEKGEPGPELASSHVPDVPPVPAIHLEGLARSQTEPDAREHDRFREGSVQSRTRQALHAAASADDSHITDPRRPSSEGDRPQPKPFHSRIARNGKTTAHVPGYTGPSAAVPVPEIVHTPPPPESRHSLNLGMHGVSDRQNSHDFSRSNSLPSLAHRGGAASRPAFTKQKQQPQDQSIDDMASHSTHTMGTNTSTDAISFIPTLQEERRPERQEKKSKGSRESNESSSKKGWGWLRSSTDQKKEDKDDVKKIKARPSKSADKIHDTTRLDVLQTATDHSRGRESLVLSRDDSNNRLEEERRKDNARRSGGAESKKEKDGIFSSLFGGGKKKGDRDSGGKRADKTRGLSPEPPRKILRADIDYNWTRFSILEERAIYRMAHIKLANPRRALYSQVLLSNFMYSYLAKVQQMHPQIQIPAYQQQKNGQKTPAQEKESEEMLQWQRYQEQQDMIGQNGATSDQYSSDQGPDGADFLDDYDSEHSPAAESRHGYAEASPYDDHSQASQHQHQQQWYEQDPDPYTRQGLFNEQRPPDDNDMW